MISIQAALLILQRTIKDNLQHKDFKRVCDLAILYKQLITGKDAEKLLIQFVRREDKALFDQRVAITQFITPAVCESIMNPFYRVGRLDNVKKILEYPERNKASEMKIAELNQRISSFWGKESLDKYLGTRFVQLSFTDPNAWIVTEFDSFDSNYEKAKPYPIEFPSDQAVNFSIKNNETEWLIIKKPVSERIENVVRNGFQFIMYLPNDVIQFSEDLTFTGNQAAGFNAEYYYDGNGKRYLVDIFKPRGGEVQAIRVGYKSDLETDARTFVNPFHAALPYFMKGIKAVSELDLTTSMHAFPQKLQYVEKCEGVDFNEPCNRGKDINGNECKKCQGTGISFIHTSAQDAITLPMPKKGEQNPLKLDDILVYKSPPVELLKFQDEYADKLERKAIRAVFNSEILLKTSVAQTATERIENKDEMYNTIQPFTENYSTVYKKKVRLIAAFTDSLEGLRIIHEFPADFKFKTVAELVADLAAANESGAPAFLIQAINKDIAAKTFADDDLAFQKFLVKTRFTPFLGKTSEEIVFILTSNMAMPEDRVLWSHNDSIFDELENEVEGFFQFTYEKQWPLIKAKIDAILAKLPSDELAIDFRNALPGSEGAEIDTPVDVEAEAKAKLKGSVGGVDGILSIQASVASGITEYEAGLAMLQILYGYDEEKSKAILGNPKAKAPAIV